MDIKLMQIEGRAPVPGADSDFDVRVCLAIDGGEEWHTIRVRPRVLAGLDASLLVASEALQGRLRQEQYALHRICRLVGRELRGRDVRLPQYVAA